MSLADRPWPPRALAAGLGALALVAWLSAGTAPLVDAAREVAHPSDFATDYVPAARLWRGESPGVDTTEGNAEATRLGLPGYADHGTPYRAHPPPSLLVVAALVPLGWPAAAWAWLAIAVLSVATTAWIAASQLAPGSPRARVVAMLALAVWPPTLHDLEKGQWSVPIAALLALAFVAARRARSSLAGALVAAAGAFKIVPVVALAGLVRGRSTRSLLLGALGASLAIGVVTLIVPGPAAWIDFVRAAPENTRGWQTGLASTTSLWGLCARLFVGGPYATPLVESELVARGVWVVLLGGLALSLVRAARRLDATPITFSAACAWLVLANPLGWTHTAVWLALPLALLARDALDRRDERGLVSVLAAFVLLSIPRQTLFALAGPAPLSPLASLALTPPLVGAVLVALAARRALGAARTATPSQAQG